VLAACASLPLGPRTLPDQQPSKPPCPRSISCCVGAHRATCRLPTPPARWWCGRAPARTAQPRPPRIPPACTAPRGTASSPAAGPPAPSLVWPRGAEPVDEADHKGAPCQWKCTLTLPRPQCLSNSNRSAACACPTAAGTGCDDVGLCAAAARTAPTAAGGRPGDSPASDSADFGGAGSQLQPARRALAVTAVTPRSPGCHDTGLNIRTIHGGVRLPFNDSWRRLFFAAERDGALRPGRAPAREADSGAARIEQQRGRARCRPGARRPLRRP